MTLALPVVHPTMPQHVLLRVGYKLDAEVIGRLERLSVRNVWVQYPGLDVLEDYISRDIIEAQGGLVRDVATMFEKLQTQATARVRFDTYCQTIADLVSNLVTHPKSGLFMDDLVGPSVQGMDLMRHSSSVAYLSLLMGLRLEGYLVKQRKHIDPGRAKEVTNLGLGAMLHDLGVSQLPQEVRQRYIETGDDADPAWREHPTLGYRLVRQEIDPSAATVVLNHHQRFDGTGYAGSAAPVLSGQRIHVFARVVALADHFDQQRRLDTPRPRPAVAVLRDLLAKPVFDGFDPQVITALFAVVPPYPPGTLVNLSDGRWAVCLDHHAGNPCRPTVQIIPGPGSFETHDGQGETIDLAQHSPSLSVAQVDAVDVSKLNFDPPRFLRDGFHSFAQW